MMDIDPKRIENQTASAMVSRILAVDLDGTLCRTDTLHEAILKIVSTRPIDLLTVLPWLFKGRADFKARLADMAIIDPAELPLSEAVVEFIVSARADGQRVVLVSASDHRQVTAVAEATGLFDEAYGSAEGRNLKGSDKAAFLIRRYGADGFDYIGDSTADLPVWAAASRAITVGAGARLAHAARAVNPNVTHLDPANGQTAAILRAMRPHQWSKNLLLFVPLLASHDPSSLVLVLLGFLAFCLTASAVYVVNDLFDLAADRAHPRKRNRPFAAGVLSTVTGAAMAVVLLALAVALALAIGEAAFLGILLLYLMATFAYSLWLKRRLIVDVLMLAGLYTLRVCAGALVANIALSPWMLGFSMFLFLALAAIKRQSELTDLLATGRSGAGRAYQVDDLPVLRGIAISAGQLAVLILALYISSADVQRLYDRPTVLWLLCPLLLYWVMRMIMKTHRGLMTDDPIVFAATDRIGQVLVIICAAVTYFAI